MDNKFNPTTEEYTQTHPHTHTTHTNKHTHTHLQLLNLLITDISTKYKMYAIPEQSAIRRYIEYVEFIVDCITDTPAETQDGSIAQIIIPIIFIIPMTFIVLCFFFKTPRKMCMDILERYVSPTLVHFRHRPR
jgi:hypothetical protein